MLLVNSFGECEKIGEGVKRNMREDVVDFDREATSAHNIGFRDIVAGEAGEEIDEEAGEVIDKVINEDFFA